MSKIELMDRILELHSLGFKLPVENQLLIHLVNIEGEVSWRILSAIVSSLEAGDYEAGLTLLLIERRIYNAILTASPYREQDGAAIPAWLQATPPSS